MSTGDSHLTRIKKESQKKIRGDKLYFKCLNGANSKQLDHYVIPVLVDEKPQTVFIDIGSNYITKFNYHGVDVNDLANRILQIWLKCRYYGVEGIAISSVLVRNDNNLNKLIREINISLKHLCKVYGLDLLCNNRIGKDLLWRDGIHLTDEGTSFLAINFLIHLNGYHKHAKSMNAKLEIQNITFKRASKLHNDCISRFKMIRPENFDSIIVGTLNKSSRSSKFDEFKLMVSGYFDVIIVMAVLHGTICMTLIRFLYDSTNLNV